MYLTRLEINKHRRDARALLSSPQRLHAAVLAGFPESRPEPEHGRILWRLDEGVHDPVLYVVSPFEPDLTHLVETVGRPTYGWQTKPYTPFLDKLTAGEQWAFRLRANPVHPLATPGGGRGRRLPHLTAAHQTDWFHTQAKRHGFQVVDSSAPAVDAEPGDEKKAPDLLLRSRATLRFTRGGRTVTLTTALFEGTLVIDDPDAVRAALIEGIGAGKGYGCALMTLTRAR